MRKIDDSAFIAEGAKVLRDVVLEKNSSVWFGAVLIFRITAWSTSVPTIPRSSEKMSLSVIWQFFTAVRSGTIR